MDWGRIRDNKCGMTGYEMMKCEITEGMWNNWGSVE
jgi:hypothetical protein